MANVHPPARTRSTPGTEKKPKAISPIAASSTIPTSTAAQW